MLGKPAPDTLPVEVARVAPDGTLVIQVGRRDREVLVVNINGSAIGLEGRVVARPRDGLVAYRIPAMHTSTRSPRGLAPDGWTGTTLDYRVWPRRAGRYELKLSLPAGSLPRKVTLSAAERSGGHPARGPRAPPDHSDERRTTGTGRRRSRRHSSADEFSGVKVFALRFVST